MYEASQASSIADLFTKLSTFAVAAGWTEDYAASDRLFLHRGTVYVAFRWASSSPVHAGIYQALGFINSATDPGNHTNDSGNGKVTGTDSLLDDERSVPLVNSSMNYWFFESGDDIKIVVETSTGVFAHFGFGMVEKLGTWTGGAYCYGYRKDPAAGSSQPAVTAGTSYLLDGLAAGTGMNLYAATLHIEGAPGEGGSSKWGVVMGNPAATLGNDRAGNSRVFINGGFRSGPVAFPFGRFSGATTDGLIPMYPIHLLYRRPSTTDLYPIGRMLDVRGINIKYLTAGQEITVGSDTWIVFPSNAKTNTGSRGQGIAYRKEVA